MKQPQCRDPLTNAFPYFRYKPTTNNDIHHGLVTAWTTKALLLLLWRMSSKHYRHVHLTTPIWGAVLPGHGTGTWISEEHPMTLTYRGKKYVQLQGAGFDSSKKALLTYRGIPYAKWSKRITFFSPHLTVGAFLFLYAQRRGSLWQLNRLSRYTDYSDSSWPSANSTEGSCW